MGCITFLGYYPLLLLGVVGILVHPHWSWGMCLVLGFGISYTNSSVSSGRISTDEGFGALKDFLRNRTLVFTPIDIKELLGDSNTSLFWVKGGTVSVSDWFVRKTNADYVVRLRNMKPVYCFLVTGLDGQQALACSRAYINTNGRSFVFLHKRPDKMKAFDQFLLQHELAHVSRRGGYQMEFVHEARALVLLNLILLLSICSSRWQLVAVLFGILLFQFDLITAKMFQRESFADFAGINGITDPKARVKAAKEATELFSDYAAVAKGKGIANWKREEIASWDTRASTMQRIAGQLEQGKRVNNQPWGMTGTGISALWMVVLTISIGIHLSHINIFTSIVALVFILEREFRALRQWPVVFRINDLTRRLLERRALLEETLPNTASV